MDKALHPEGIPKLFAKAWNARRADWLASLFVADADFINVVGIWWENRSDIQQAHDYGLRVIFNKSALKVGKVKVKWLSDDCAVVHARMRLSGQTPKEHWAGLRQNMFLFVLQKQGPYWLAVSAQNTDIVVGAETNVRDEQGAVIPTDYRQHRP